jgi:hypothetical protein
MGRSISDLMTGILGQVEAQKAAASVPPPSASEGLKQQLDEAKASGNTTAVSIALGNIKEKREELMKTGLVTGVKRRKRSVVPSPDRIKEMLSARASASPASATPIINASREQMRDIQGEINSWGATPSSPGQWAPTRLAETTEAQEMAASPDGPSNPPANLTSTLMDKLEAHHGTLTRLLKGLPDQLRAHAQHSPYFGPAHNHFANQLESRGEVTSFRKSDRESLREKRDLIQESPIGGSKFEIKKRNAILDQNFAAMTYGDSGASYTQDVPAGGPVAERSLARRGAALNAINKQISDADLNAMQNVPAHVKALTVDLPARLAALKGKMQDIRENGSFKTDDPSVNHKAVMDIADELSTINNSINSSIMAGSKSAIADTFKGTGLTLQNKFKNFLGTSIHKKTFEHIKWMGKSLTQKQPGESWRWHEEPHPDFVEGVKPDNLTRVLKGLAVTQGLTKEDVLSKRGHIWGLASKDIEGRRKKGAPREQLEINEENARMLQNSKEVDETGVRAKDLGNRMLRIIKDYNAGNTAKYGAWELPAEWQPTSGKGGSGTRRVAGSGDVKAARAQQDLFPYTTEAIEAVERRSRPIEVTDSEGNKTRVAAGTGGVFVRGTKNKAPRSQSVLSKEAGVSKVSREAAAGKVVQLSSLAGAVERAKTAVTTYDRDGNTKPISEEDAKLINADDASTVEVYNHQRAHQQLIEKHVETVKTGGGRTAIPREDRKILGPSGMAEVNRRAKL